METVSRGVETVSKDKLLSHPLLAWCERTGTPLVVVARDLGVSLGDLSVFMEGDVPAPLDLVERAQRVTSFEVKPSDWGVDPIDLEDSPSIGIRRILLPGDTNHRGEVFGGALMSEMDLAGVVEARKHTSHDVATRGVSDLEFLKPVSVGDVVTFWVRLECTGRTSLCVLVEVISGPRDELVARGRFTYVAVSRSEGVLRAEVI